MPLTPADVRNKQFTNTRLRPGYAEEEVDAFLDEVETELERLVQENDELRSRLAECLRGGQPAVAELSAPLADPEPGTLAPAGMPGAAETAVRVLELAQQTADQAIADARREADETLTRARREADEVLTAARQEAERLTGDAQTQAEDLERTAQERHRQATGALTEERETLEQRITDLRAFEREYRSRLKAHVEGLLHDLDAGAGWEETGEPGRPSSAADPQTHDSAQPSAAAIH